MTYRVAVIGAGSVSRKHMEAIAAMDQLQAAGIADVQVERGQEAAKEFGTHAYTDYRVMVEQEKPDIVVITLPHFLHKEAAVWCAQQGCHLMLEKPMALTTEECDVIIEAARTAKIKLMIGHTQHFHARNRKAKEIIQSGLLGRLIMIHDVRHKDYFSDTRPDWFFHHTKAGGGIFMNLGSHSIDKIQYLTGSKIVKVKACVSYESEKGDVEGSGIAFVETASGIPATICQSGYHGVNREETELIFTHGMLKLTGSSLFISDIHREYKPVPVDKTQQAFSEQFVDLIHSLEQDREPECSGSYGRSVIEAVTAMFRSSRQETEITL